jgi:hypothetical protein
VWKVLQIKGGIIKVKKLIVLVCLAALMCFGFVGCKEEGITTPETTAVAPAEEAAAPAVEEAAPAEEAVPATH